MRLYPGRRFLSCMPRTPGSVTTTIEDGPRGQLIEPLEVTCTTTVTANDLRVWQADLEVAWLAGEGHAAGRWARQILFDSDGTVHMEADVAPGTGLPLDFPGDPSTTELPTEVATFAPGDLVRSVGTGVGTAFYDVDTAVLPPEPHLYAEPGALLVIVSGPEVVRRPGLLHRRYRRRGRLGGRRGQGRAGAGIGEPSCPPSPDATDLVYLSVLERRRCARRRGDPWAGPGRPPGRARSVQGVGRERPGLAGRGTRVGPVPEGIDGLDPGLPVVLAPGSRASRPRAGSPSAATTTIPPRRPAGSSTPRSGATDPCRSMSRSGAARSGSSSPASNRRRDRDAQCDAIFRWNRDRITGGVEGGRTGGACVAGHPGLARPLAPWPACDARSESPMAVGRRAGSRGSAGLTWVAALHVPRGNPVRPRTSEATTATPAPRAPAAVRGAAHPVRFAARRGTATGSGGEARAFVPDRRGGSTTPARG